jgi:hypothetical protein
MGLLRTGHSPPCRDIGLSWCSQEMIALLPQSHAFRQAGVHGQEYSGTGLSIDIQSFKRIHNPKDFSIALKYVSFHRQGRNDLATPSNSHELNDRVSGVCLASSACASSNHVNSQALLLLLLSEGSYFLILIAFELIHRSSHKSSRALRTMKMLDGFGGR